MSKNNRFDCNYMMAILLAGDRYRTRLDMGSTRYPLNRKTRKMLTRRRKRVRKRDEETLRCPWGKENKRE